MQYANHNNMI